jgi:DNA modification methylase
LYHQRLNDNIDECQYIVGDSLKVLDNIEMVDYIVTSPPYHNILRNNSKGTRNNTGKNYRMSARDGVEYYSELDNDLGNFDKYEDFLTALKNIMSKAYICLRNKKYASIIISDFTVDKKEMCVQSDVVRLMQDIGFSFVGTTILIQTVKPLYPFGYPYAYKINHHHQNIINFRKDEL